MFAQEAPGLGWGRPIPRLSLRQKRPRERHSSRTRWPTVVVSRWSLGHSLLQSDDTHAPVLHEEQRRDGATRDALTRSLRASISAQSKSPIPIHFRSFGAHHMRWEPQKQASLHASATHASKAAEAACSWDTHMSCDAAKLLWKHALPGDEAEGAWQLEAHKTCPSTHQTLAASLQAKGPRSACSRSWAGRADMVCCASGRPRGGGARPSTTGNASLLSRRHTRSRRISAPQCPPKCPPVHLHTTAPDLFLGRRLRACSTCRHPRPARLEPSPLATRR